MARPADPAPAGAGAPDRRPSLAEWQARLAEHFPGAVLAVTDDSHLHAGHAGAQGGAGHFTVTIRHPRFAGLTPVARHRLVYDAVADWLPGRVHALVIRASAP